MDGRTGTHELGDQAMASCGSLPTADQLGGPSTHAGSVDSTSTPRATCSPSSRSFRRRVCRAIPSRRAAWY